MKFNLDFTKTETVKLKNFPETCGIFCKHFFFGKFVSEIKRNYFIESNKNEILNVENIHKFSNLGFKLFCR